MHTLMTLLSKKYKHYLLYARALEVINQHWTTMVKELSVNIRPVNIFNNQLIVECNNPMWLSEIDYFQDNIIQKIHALFIEKRISVRITALKAVFNASYASSNKPQFENNMPNEFEDRILKNISLKRQEGAILCKSCGKVWDKQEICRLCQLTSS